MNIYDLSRNFWDFAFENPDKIKPNHIAMYFFAIEHCNRLGWKEKFGFPTTMVMEAISIKSYNTYIKTLHDLVEYGFIVMIEKSKNQYSANIIALSNFNKALDKALDKALINHSTKQCESIVQSTVQSNDSIDIQIYNNTNTPIYNNKEGEKQVFPSSQNQEENQNEDSDAKQPTAELSKKVAQKKVFTKAKFKEKLLGLQVEEKDADEWIEVRRQKRAVFTDSAIENILDECKKFNMPFPEAIKACAKFGWQGFKYEWYQNRKQEENGTNQTKYRTVNTGHTSSASPNVSGKISARAILASRLNGHLQRNDESGSITIDVEAQ